MYKSLKSFKRLFSADIERRTYTSTGRITSISTGKIRKQDDGGWYFRCCGQEGFIIPSDIRERDLIRDDHGYIRGFWNDGVEYRLRWYSRDEMINSLFTRGGTRTNPVFC